MRRQRPPPLIVGTVAVALASCAVGPHYTAPPVVASQPAWIEPAGVPAAGVPGAGLPAAAAPTPPDAVWWRALGDPVLSGLVESAVQHNLDLRAATAQVREARALRAAAFGARFPQVNGSGTAGRDELSENGELPINRIPGFSRRFNLFDAGFDASWELDFWGRNARAAAAADARTAAAVEAMHAVQIEVVAEVVRSYVDLRSAQARLASATDDADARGRSADLVNARRRAGESSASDAVLAMAQAASSRGELPGLKSDARAAVYALALLTARPPEALVDLAATAAPLPATPPAVGAGLRSDLLRRRPDIRQAERELAAATADVAVATADLFPRLTLAAAVGRQSLDTGNFFSGASARYQFGPSLTWPIFSAGSIRARIRASDARADAAAASYEKAVLGALADSETALNRYAAAGAQRREREAALSESAQAMDLAHRRYAAGEDDRVAFLASQSDYDAALLAALQSRAAELTALVALYKALGGGW